MTNCREMLAECSGARRKDGWRAPSMPLQPGERQAVEPGNSVNEMSIKGRSHWPLLLLSSLCSVFNIFLPLVLVRILDPHEVGVFKVFFLYLASAPAFALTAGVMSGLPYWAGKGEHGIRPIQISSLIVLGFSFVAAAVVFVSRESIAAAFSWTEMEATLFSVALIGAVAGTFFEEAAIASGRVWRGALFYAGFELLRTAVILASVLYFRTLTAVLTAHTVIVLLKVLTGYIYGSSLKLIGWRIDRQSVQQIWGYAFPVSIAWIFGIFVASADQFILSTSIPAAEFALYAIGCLAIPPLLILEQSVARVLIPQLSEAFHQDQIERAARLYQSASENLSFLIIPAVTGLIVFAEPIIEVLFTSRYADAADYLRLFALSYLFLAIPFDALARAKGQARWILRTLVFFSIFSLLSTYLAAKTFGTFGALTGVLVSGALMRAYTVHYFGRQTRLKIHQFLPLRSYAAFTLLSLVLALGAELMRPLFATDRMWFVISGGLFGIFYLLFALPLKSRLERQRFPASKVLILTQRLEIGGLERMVLHLCEELMEQRRWFVRVLAYDQPPATSKSLLSQFIEKEIPVEAFQKPPGFSLIVVWRILCAVYRHDIHVLHSHDLGGLIYAVCAKMCSFGRTVLVHTQHSFIHLQQEPRYRMYEKFLTRFVDQLTVVSEDTRKTYLELGVREDKLHLIQNGVQFLEIPTTPRREKLELRRTIAATIIASEMRGELEKHLHDHWILYLARFFPGKGQEHAIGVWSQLDPSIRARSVLCFIGPESAPGQYEAIRKRVSEAPDFNRILILGPSSDPHRWLSVGDIYLSCSEFEGMPLGPLEAVGSGLPAVLSSIPGHEFLKESSVQYPINDYTRGAHEIERIVLRIEEEGEDFLLQLWKQGEGLRNRFSIAEMSRKYAVLYARSFAEG